MPSISSTLVKMHKSTQGGNSTGKLFPVKALQQEKISIHQVLYTMELIVEGHTTSGIERGYKLLTSENTSLNSNKSRVLHTRYVRLGGIFEKGGPYFSLI